MNKKKIIWGIIIFIIFAIIVWIDIPYIFPSKNLISRNDYAYTYRQARILDLDSLLLNRDPEEFPLWIDITESDEVNKLISIIDDLSFRKSRKSKDHCNYSVSFVVKYKETESTSYTGEVFTISFYANNIIGFNEEPNYRQKYYKILDKDFDIRKVIDEIEAYK